MDWNQLSKDVHALLLHYVIHECDDTRKAIGDVLSVLAKETAHWECRRPE